MSLTAYIDAAMRRAVYETLSDEEGVYGEIADLRGVYAHAHSLEECREQLRSVLEGWLEVKLGHGDADIPVLDGIDLNDSLSAG